MNKYERRVHFERLCELRATYATRGDADEAGEMTVAAAIAYGELLAQDLTGAPETAESPSA